MALAGKKIVIGICGSISAYKITYLIRLLIKQDAEVKVVMTEAATAFITPLTLSTLSKEPVLVDYYNKKTGEWNNHVHLALEADYILIAPATANTIAKLSTGLCDNLLSAIYLSAKCPVFFAPAMDLDMWKHPTTEANVAKLLSYGNILIPPNTGELASGLTGEGRLAEPEQILDFLEKYSEASLPLTGKNVVVTAGPTYEAIDPVRFIGNHSSGKMGYAIAAQFRSLGADVVLISGPSALNAPAGLTLVSVVSASDMLEACQMYAPVADIIIMSAAVADYTPLVKSTQKIKKKQDQFSVELKKTTDILATLGEMKKPGQLLIGFALETNNELENAKEKLKRKNLDFIMLNSLQDKGAGFGVETNKITILSKSGGHKALPLLSKQEVAKVICDLVVENLDHPDIQN